jgi:RNA polymerase sigma factor (sigma-70 family)
VRPLVSDERLSRRLATGEAAGFDELYRRYSHRLSAYASGLLGDRAAGEDVAQVALLNAYQALRKGKEPEKVRPWLFRIAHNEAVDMLARRRELLDGLDLENRPAPEDPTETRGALLDALAKLPDRQRRAYVLREVHGLRVAEIASELSLAVPQVEQALFAARNRLAEELVFGDLSCDSAQRLAEGPLAGVERKALRHHFRTCDRCRAAGVRVAPGLIGFDWLRGRLADLLVGGAAPAAAKVGAVVAASVATGVTVGPTVLEHEPHFSGVTSASAARTVTRRPRVAAVRTTTLLAAREPVALPTTVAAAPARKQVRHREHDSSGEQHGDAVASHDSHDGEHTITTRDDTHRHGSDESGDGGEDHATTTTKLTVRTSSHGSERERPRNERDRPEKEHPSSPEPTTTTTETTPASPPPTTTTSDGGLVSAVLVQVTTTTPRPRGD